MCFEKETAARLALQRGSPPVPNLPRKPDDTRFPPRKDHDGDTPMGSGTRMTNLCVTSQPTLLIASRKPFPKKRKSRA